MAARTLPFEAVLWRSEPANAGRGAAATAIPWWHGWILAVAFPCAALLFFPPAWPRWAFMWTLAWAIYAGCKWLTWRRTAIDAPRWRHAAYLLAWTGMDAAAFLSRRSQHRAARTSIHEWMFALFKFALGMALLSVGIRSAATGDTHLAGWVGLVGIVFALHFGIFHLLSCAWRSSGVDARPLMHWPVASTSVSDFWARRWNTAFRDLVHRFLFRPAYPWIGARGAMLVVFIVSGLVHELVITLPAGGGYGGPTAYFVIQAWALTFERGALGRTLGLARGWRGRLFAIVALLAPVVLLFPPPFIDQIMLPMLRSMGGIL